MKTLSRWYFVLTLVALDARAAKSSRHCSTLSGATTQWPQIRRPNTAGVAHDGPPPVYFSAGVQ